MAFRSKRTVRAAGETETSQDWLQLDEGDPGFQLLVFLWFLNQGSTQQNKTNKLWDFSPPANYTDRATDACR
jgi:hypothetical protein